MLLTNGARLGLQTVREALRRFDRRVVKLDAGQESTFRAIHRPRGTSLHAVVTALRTLGQPFTVQSLFFRGAMDNSTPSLLQAWASALLAVRPADVQVTTLDRGAELAGLEPVPAADLEAIAAGVRRLGFPAQAFPCSAEERFSLPPA